MFVSHNNGTTTTTIKVNVFKDMFWACLFVVVGLALIGSAFTQEAVSMWKLGIGALLVFSGASLGFATIRLIVRSVSTYNKAASWRKD